MAVARRLGRRPVSGPERRSAPPKQRRGFQGRVRGCLHPRARQASGGRRRLRTMPSAGRRETASLARCSPSPVRQRFGGGYGSQGRVSGSPWKDQGLPLSRGRQGLRSGSGGYAQGRYPVTSRQAPHRGSPDHEVTFPWRNRRVRKVQSPRKGSNAPGTEPRELRFPKQGPGRWSRSMPGSAAPLRGYRTSPDPGRAPFTRITPYRDTAGEARTRKQGAARLRRRREVSPSDARSPPSTSG